MNTQNIDKPLNPCTVMQSHEASLKWLACSVIRCMLELRSFRSFSHILGKSVSIVYENQCLSVTYSVLNIGAYAPVTKQPLQFTLVVWRKNRALIGRIGDYSVKLLKSPDLLLLRKP